MTSDTSPAQAAWLALFRAQTRARNAADAALKAAGLPPLEWYDVLWELERAMPGGLRPFELEKAVLLPQHGISRLTDRMVKAGMLTRLPCPDDKRGFRLIPSPAGLKLRQDMWRIYGPVISGFWEPGLSVDEQAELARLLGAAGRP